MNPPRVVRFKKGTVAVKLLDGSREIPAFIFKGTAVHRAIGNPKLWRVTHVATGEACDALSAGLPYLTNAMQIACNWAKLLQSWELSETATGEQIREAMRLHRNDARHHVDTSRALAIAPRMKHGDVCL